MGCVLRGLVLRDGKSLRAQVHSGKQRLTLAEDNRCKRKVQGIDEPRLQVLPHGGDAASDLDVLVTRRLFRQPQRLLDSAGDKVKRRPALHHQRLTPVVRQNESRRMVRRIGTPPSPPQVVHPRSTNRTKHVAAKDEGAKVFHGPPSERVVHIGRSALLPLHGAECPGMKKPLKDLWAPLSQRIVQALLDPRTETVQRNTESRDTNLWHECSCPLPFRFRDPRLIFPHSDRASGINGQTRRNESLTRCPNILGAQQNRVGELSSRTRSPAFGERR